MRRSIVFATPELMSLVPVAVAAEDRGFHRVWTTENPGRDAMIRALVFGQHTSRIGVATGITYAFTRAPLAMAAAAADINDALGGRFALGLGAGTQGMRVRWYDVPDFDRPATRLSEYADLLRTAWTSSGALSFKGEFYNASYPEADGARMSVPLWGSGINPAMLRAAARSFDGVALHPIGSNLAYLREVVAPALAEGSVHRSDPVELALWRIVSIHEDGDVARARARKSLAFYFSTPSYGTVADVAGWGAVAERVRDAYKDSGPSWSEHAQLVPEEMVDDFCLAGTPDEVRSAWAAQQADMAETGATEVVFQTVTGTLGTSESFENLMAITSALSPDAR